MKEIETLKIDTKALQAAILKYRKLVTEIESGAHKSDQMHSAMKLGIFLEQAVGKKVFRELAP